MPPLTLFLIRKTGSVFLVTDYRMPGRDGGDLLRQIEREYPHIVRILVTAYVDKSVLLETINSGEIFQILEKPLGLMEIRRVLRHGHVHWHANAACASKNCWPLMKP